VRYLILKTRERHYLPIINLIISYLNKIVVIEYGRSKLALSQFYRERNSVIKTEVENGKAEEILSLAYGQ
jgi:hypothetical protein